MVNLPPVGTAFVLSPAMNQSLLPHSVPSFSDACRYIRTFCLRHNIMGHSHAALATVLLFTYMRYRCENQILQLPAPRISARKTPPLIYANAQSQCDWMYQSHYLDKLLTLSCYTRGTSSILLSVCYEPSIECNAATPWLQEALAAIDSLTGSHPYILGRMCMEKQPGVACLWLGSTILGMQNNLWQALRYNQWPIGLNSAAWSGTLQSFIQQPVTNPLVIHGYVERADECRLLFLARTTHQSRVSIVRWKPFGSTPLADVDIEVRLHTGCEGHGLQYNGCSPNYAKEKSTIQ
jgi:hypothetical protein